MSNKKVAGITVINTPTYGAVLQAFALQERIKTIGHEYTLLNYVNRAQEVKFTFWGYSEYMPIKYRLYKKIQYPIMKIRLNRILRFQNEMCNLSDRIVNHKELKKVAKNYDVFVTGSDQVWNNQEINHFDSAYFLSFVSGKTTLSYAASFGKTYEQLQEKDIEFYANNLSNIKYVSCREDNGVAIVRKICGRDARFVCDPVFLLSKNQWRRYAVKPKKQKPFILVYLIGNGINDEINQRILNDARKASKDNGLRVVNISRGLASMVKERAFSIPTVPEWLGLINDAELVLTNSFHGSAFSVIFEKNFFCYLKGDTTEKMNTRVYSLFSALGIEHRIIDIEREYLLHTRRTIDYESVKKKLSPIIEFSVRFIEKAIADKGDE